MSIFVEGQFQPAHGSDLIPVIGPAEGAAFGSFPAGDETDVQRAVTSARRALNDPSWAGTTGADRAAYLNRVAELLEARTEEMARLLTAENGLTLSSSRVSIGKSAAAYRYFAGLAENLVVEERRSSQGAHAIVRREPVGVVLLLVPWNGPQSLHQRTAVASIMEARPGARRRLHSRHQTVARNHVGRLRADGVGDGGGRPGRRGEHGARRREHRPPTRRQSGDR